MCGHDEADLVTPVDAVLALSETGVVTWAVDLNSGGAGLLIALLADRERRDQHPMRVDDEISVELTILISPRTDLMRDRTRAINRLRALITGYFPAFERALEVRNSAGGLILSTGYQTPDGLRRPDRTKSEGWLQKRKAYNASRLADVAIEAANMQLARVAGKMSPGRPSVSWRARS
ncbi:hypothetical protein ABH922_004705 [Rhodococcus sp. 27YEA15]|uniref:IS110 family transposase n=1 Tax=Rhodococcus sp. 27YEA15 TaxID=3156259 RepID=UPI003C7BA7EC